MPLAFTRMPQMPKRALQGFDLARVVDLLALGQFQRFEDFFHLFENALEVIDDMRDLLDGLADAGGFGSRFLDLATLMAFRTLMALVTFVALLAFGTVGWLRARGINRFAFQAMFGFFNGRGGRFVHGRVRGFFAVGRQWRGVLGRTGSAALGMPAPAAS